MHPFSSDPNTPELPPQVADDTWENLLKNDGPKALFDRLRKEMREKKDHTGLFYTLLMEARHKLGLAPTPTGPSSDIPEVHHETFENAIRDAATQVGQWALDQGQLAAAWNYYRLLGQPQPIQSALAKIEMDQLSEDQFELVEAAIRLAFHEGLDPVRGFGWILSRYGLCNAITTLSHPETPGGPQARLACLDQLIAALHAELAHRLAAEIERVEGKSPLPSVLTPPLPPGTIASLIQSRDWLFEEEAYHIDLSHLSSVVQMSQDLPPGESLARARDLCAYGKKLKGRFVPTGESPFDPLFEGYDRFLAAINKEDTDTQVHWFEAHATRELAEGNAYPAEVLRKLLDRLGRKKESLAWAGKTLSAQALAQPCREAEDFSPMIEAAKAQGDVVHLVAALLEREKRTP